MAAPKTTEKNWFWNLHGKAQGPSSLEDMELLIRDGRLLKHYLVFREGGLRWSEAAQWPELKTFFDARDALTAGAIGETASPASPAPTAPSGGPHWIVLVKEMRDDGVFFRQKGPFTVAEVQEMIRQGQIDPRDHGWTQGMTRWAPLAEVDAFAHGNHKIGARGQEALDNVATFAPVMDVLPPPVQLVPPTPAAIPAAAAPTAAEKPATLPTAMPALVAASPLVPQFPEAVDDDLTQTFEAPLENFASSSASKPAATAPAPAPLAPRPPPAAPAQKFSFDLPKAAAAAVSAPPAPVDDELDSTMIAENLAFPLQEAVVAPKPSAPLSPPSPALRKATSKISPPMSEEDRPAPEVSAPEFVDNYQPSRQVKAGNRWLAPILFVGAVAGVAAVILYPDKSGFDQLFGPKKAPVEASQASFPEVNTAPVALPPAAPPAVAPPPASVAPEAANASATSATNDSAAKSAESSAAPVVSAPSPAAAPAGKSAPVTITVRNSQAQLIYNAEERVLELHGPFKKGEALRVVLSSAPGQVVGLPSLYHAFSEAATEDRVFRVNLGEKQVPDGYYRFTVSAKTAIVDDPVAIAKDPAKLRGQLARQRKLSAYDQQQERKKLLGAIRSVSALIKEGQKAKTKKELAGIDGKLKNMASKEIQAIQSARHELFFPEGWQAVAKGVNALKKAAGDSRRQPASYAGELEAQAKNLRALDGKVKAQTQFR